MKKVQLNIQNSQGSTVTDLR